MHCIFQNSDHSLGKRKNQVPYETPEEPLKLLPHSLNSSDHIRQHSEPGRPPKDSPALTWVCSVLHWETNG